MDSRQFQNKDHGDTMPKQMCDICLCSLQINIKSEPGAVQYFRLCVDYLRKINFLPAVGLFCPVGFLYLLLALSHLGPLGRAYFTVWAHMISIPDKINHFNFLFHWDCLP